MRRGLQTEERTGREMHESEAENPHGCPGINSLRRICPDTTRAAQITGKCEVLLGNMV